MNTKDCELHDRRSFALWRVGAEAVHGQRVVYRKLKAVVESSWMPSATIAVGKAACAMAQGAIDARAFGDRAIVVTKHDHTDSNLPWPGKVDLFEAGHPIPDAASRAAGEALIAFVDNLAVNTNLLMLVSGGASALVECLLPGEDWDAFERHIASMIASDVEIAEINCFRTAHSAIKGGKLLDRLQGGSVRSIVISDVSGDDPAIIGSGIAVAPPAYTAAAPVVAACNEDARKAVAAHAISLGLPVRDEAEDLTGSVPELALQLADRLTKGPPGVYVWGGEPTISLPSNPGRGGRNQALALHMAQRLHGTIGIEVCVAGTDGTDGPTDAAGGVVDGTTLDRITDPFGALERAAAYDALAEAGALLKTGPTGTNVMDLAIAIKTDPSENSIGGTR